MNKKEFVQLNFIDIGKRIKLLRGSMQQDEFANLFDMSRQQDVSKIEHAKLKPSLELILKISVYFNKSMEWILTGEDNMNPIEDICFNIVKESNPEYLPSNKTSFSNLPSEIKDAFRYAVKAYEILISKTGYAGALRENIDWFRKAVANEERIVYLEEDLSSLKKKLSESGIL